MFRWSATLNDGKATARVSFEYHTKEDRRESVANLKALYIEQGWLIKRETYEKGSRLTKTIVY